MNILLMMYVTLIAVLFKTFQSSVRPALGTTIGLQPLLKAADGLRLIIEPLC